MNQDYVPGAAVAISYTVHALSSRRRNAYPGILSRLEHPTGQTSQNRESDSQAMQL